MTCLGFVVTLCCAVSAMGVSAVSITTVFASEIELLAIVDLYIVDSGVLCVGYIVGYVLQRILRCLFSPRSFRFIHP